MFRTILYSTVFIFSLSSHAAENISTEADLIQSFESIFGVNKGKRRNHTKGFCFEGRLVPGDSAIHQYSSSDLFKNDASVIGRLSHKGGKLSPPDNKPADVGLSLSIVSSTNEQYLMSMNTEDFFPVATAEEFAELMRAKAAGGNAVKEFAAGNKEFQKYKAHMSSRENPLTSYEGRIYDSINSFYLVNNKSEKTAVRWAFLPAGERELVIEPTENFFFENLQENLAKGDVKWNMNVTLAADGDDINNPAVQWSDQNTTITAATLYVDSISQESEGRCDEINYDPMVLSTGIEPSEDPMLQIRRNVYAITFGKRLSGQ